MLRAATAVPALALRYSRDTELGAALPCPTVGKAATACSQRYPQVCVPRYLKVFSGLIHRSSTEQQSLT